MSASSTPYAADWVGVTLGDAETYSVDRSTIVRDGSRVNAWVMVEYANAKDDPDGKYRSVKIRNVFDCDRRTGGFTDIIRYSKLNGDGHVVSQFQFNGAQHGVAPETIEETLLKFVCASDPKAKQGAK